MKTLTKRTLAKQLVRSNIPGLSEVRAVDIIETIADLITMHFVEGGSKVALRGFGSFELYRRKQFSTSNPRTGQRFTMGARKTIGFRPSSSVKQRINL